MICHACLAYSQTAIFTTAGFDAWLCDKCGSTFTISQARPASYYRPHPNAIAFNDCSQLTNENMRQAMKEFKPKAGAELYAATIDCGIDPEQGRVNIMSEDGRRIFFSRFGWELEKQIDPTVSKYRYNGTT